MRPNPLDVVTANTYCRSGKDKGKQTREEGRGVYTYRARSMARNVLSLCSGIGGIDLGLEMAGLKTIGQVEIDPYAQRVLAKHWPEVPRHDDVRTAVDWWRSEHRPGVDLVAAGFPCQPVSLAGKGLAQADPRWLWPAVANVVRELRPGHVFLENVPGLVNRGLADVLGSLAQLGFHAVWGCVPAASVGAPHLRTRVFVVAAHPQRVELRDEPWCSGGQDWSRETVAGFDGATWSLADTESQRRGEGRRSGQPLRTGTATVEPEGRTGTGERRHGHETWAVEPDVGRVAHGVPARVDRLRVLGNAVVPQVIAHVARLFDL